MGHVKVVGPRDAGLDLDPGRILAARFGASVRTVVADVGVLQQTLFTRACSAIATGDLDVAVVCGAEAKYRDLRARIAGIELSDIQQGDVVPDAGQVHRKRCSPAARAKHCCLL